MVCFETNNYAEFKSLLLLMKRSLEKKNPQLQVFCDSELTIEWMKGETKSKGPTYIIWYFIYKKLPAPFKTYISPTFPRNIMVQLILYQRRH